MAVLYRALLRAGFMEWILPGFNAQVFVIPWIRERFNVCIESAQKFTDIQVPYRNSDG